MIINFRQPFTPYLYHIDIKSYDWPWLEEGWKNINGYIIRVYAIDHIPRGFVSFKVQDIGTIELSKLCVHPDYRQQGIGTQLHNDLLRIAEEHKIKEITVTLYEFNEFLEIVTKWGWEAGMVVPGLFPDGKDGWVFTKEVTT